jgi:hypothetical protein
MIIEGWSTGFCSVLGSGWTKGTLRGKNDPLGFIFFRETKLPTAVFKVAPLAGDAYRKILKSCTPLPVRL